MPRLSGRRMKRLSIHHPPTTPVTIVVWKHSCRYVYRLDVGRHLASGGREVLSDETKSTQNPTHPARSRVRLATANNKNPQHNTAQNDAALMGCLARFDVWLLGCGWIALPNRERACQSVSGYIPSWMDEIFRFPRWWLSALVL